MLDGAEPTIRKTCQEIWRRQQPRGIELKDLYQEGRIAAFEAAGRILAARNPLGLVVTVVRRRIGRVLHDLVLQCPTLLRRPLLPARPGEAPLQEASENASDPTTSGLANGLSPTSGA
jgi:hypothetical protein